MRQGGILPIIPSQTQPFQGKNDNLGEFFAKRVGRVHIPFLVPGGFNFIIPFGAKPFEGFPLLDQRDSGFSGNRSGFSPFRERVLVAGWPFRTQDGASRPAASRPQNRSLVEVFSVVT